IEPEIHRETYQKGDDPHLGPGSGIVLWAEDERGTRLGADALGERGKSAEVVGKTAASSLVDELFAGMAIDSHLCDMIIPYLAIASGTSKIGVTKITNHLTTNIWVTERILETHFDLQSGPDETAVLTIEGTRLSL
ncbi:MAG: RNA 3'-terminal phosphate cyclase, partial [Promethearchaeota archaeon]